MKQRSPQAESRKLLERWERRHGIYDIYGRNTVPRRYATAFSAFAGTAKDTPLHLRELEQIREFLQDLPDAAVLEVTEIGITTVPGLSAVTIEDDGVCAIGISHGFLMALVHSYLPFTRAMRAQTPSGARRHFESLDGLSSYLLLEIDKFASFSGLFDYTWQYLRLNLLYIVLHEAGHIAARTEDALEVGDEENFADEYAAGALHELIRVRTADLARWLGITPNKATLIDYFKFSMFYYFSAMTALRPVDSANCGHASERTRYERLLARVEVPSTPRDQGPLHLEKFQVWSSAGKARGKNDDEFQLMMKHYILARLRATDR